MICGNCRGEGTIVQNFDEVVTCFDCSGTGWIEEED